jgi:ATP phosphoribosyltransferase regulatory subunit HisZ
LSKAGGKTSVGSHSVNRRWLPHVTVQFARKRSLCYYEEAMATREEARRRQREKNQAAIELLRQWREEGDVEEQKRAFEALKQTLGKDRMGYRRIYP